MIIDQLKHDIENTLLEYIRKYSTGLSYTRKIDIEIIRKMLQLNDPIQICKRLNVYLNNISIPLLSWLPFLELNVFINTLRLLLSQEKYQEVALLKTLLNEKEQLILQFQHYQNPPESNNALKQKINALLLDIDLLKKENHFLYQSLESLDQKNKCLERKYLEVIERIQYAEESLIQFNQIKTAFLSQQLFLN